MIKYYYQVLILITFLFFVSKTQKIGNKDIKKYDSIFPSKNDPMYSTKNQEKNKTGSNQERKLDEKEPIRVFVDLTSIEADFGTREVERSYLDLDDVRSAVDEVKETLKKLIKVKPLANLKINKDLSEYGFSDAL